MATVVKEYTLKLTTKEAQQNLKQVTDSLELQDDALIRIQQDLVKYEKKLADGFRTWIVQIKSKNKET